ncbi:DUF3054 domain-containing protein [Agromyces sp. NPDC060279]|uniref:DUF3054 domain-containing protein n=1 Tax=Agromyces sp. NPDC060279 TaxID=3347092 RepID=UPI00364771E4
MIRQSAVWAAAVADVLLVALFVVIGRRSHAEGLDLAGLWQTAWPFLAALVVGWLVSLAWRRPLALWPSGVVIWAVTLVGGMLLRAASGQGTQLPFVLVAAGTLALFLLGWRAIVALVARLRSRRTAS